MEPPPHPPRPSHHHPATHQLEAQEYQLHVPQQPEQGWEQTGRLHEGWEQTRPLQEGWEQTGRLQENLQSSPNPLEGSRTSSGSSLLRTPTRNPNRSAGDVLQDIGTMLADLTDELDTMLKLDKS